MTAAAIPCAAGRVLVTGATGGIGWAICRRLAALGWRLALADRDADLAARHAAALGAGHVGLGADLTDPAAASALPARAATALGGLECVVNNAGITDSSGRMMIDLPRADFDRVTALNITAVEALCEAALALIAPGGSIVNLASGAAFRPLPVRGPYSATKAAVVALTRALAPRAVAQGVAITAVAPGYTRTPLVARLQDEGRVDLAAVARAIPSGRVADPEDIAAAVAFCAGPGGRALAGSVIGVDGGSSAGPAWSGPGPQAGSGAAGVVVSVGPSILPECDAALQDHAGLAAHPALAAIIDTRALTGSLSAAARLSQVQAIARACAAHPGRARSVALLFVTAQGETASQQAASAALAMAARTLALEFAPAGIRVNCIVWNGQGTPEDLGALCRFLAGPEAVEITGQAIQAGLFALPAGQPRNPCIAL